MAYKISGTLSDAARIVVIKESDWSVEKCQECPAGYWSIGSLASGAKLVAGRKSDGEVVGYGNVSPIEYTSPGRGVFGGGFTGPSNIIDYITISTPGNATNFGDLTVKRRYPAATSNG